MGQVCSGETALGPSAPCRSSGLPERVSPGLKLVSHHGPRTPATAPEPQGREMHWSPGALYSSSQPQGHARSASVGILTHKGWSSEAWGHCMLWSAARICRIGPLCCPFWDSLPKCANSGSEHSCHGIAQHARLRDRVGVGRKHRDPQRGTGKRSLTGISSPWG